MDSVKNTVLARNEAKKLEDATVVKTTGCGNRL